jgi:hypothetical protein
MIHDLMMLWLRRLPPFSQIGDVAQLAEQVPAHGCLETSSIHLVAATRHRRV